MRDFHNYKVWEKAHRFALGIYKKTKSFPKEEIFGITSQIRRAATSIPFNIAAGSASEVEEELLLSYDLELMDKTSYQQLNKEVNDIKAMLNKLIETLH